MPERSNRASRRNYNSGPPTKTFGGDKITSKNYRINSRAFSLIEMVMVMVLVSFLGGVAAPLTIELIESFKYSVDLKDLSSTAEVVLKRMSQEIRRLRNDTSVLTANATTYRFINVSGQTLQFSLAGTNLQRFDGVNTDVLAANVSALTFTYLDGNLATIVSPIVNPSATNIKFVRIDFSVSSAGNAINYTTLVRVRNVLQESDLFF